MTSAGSRRAEPARRRGRLVVAALLALLLVGGLAFVVLLLRDDDPSRVDPAGSGSTGSTGSSGSDDDASDEPDPLDDPLSPESLDLRYAALADSVTAGAERCHRGKLRDGQGEHVMCDTAIGTLELVTYASKAALEERRTRSVTDEPGGILDAGSGGTLMGFEAPAVKPAKGTGKGKGAKKAAGPKTYLYRDDTASLQSATYTTEAGTELDRLVELYAATGPTRPFPAGPSSKKLVRFARRWVEPDECLRTVTVNPGALEESYCDVTGPVEVFVGRFATLDQLKAYRKILVASAIADDRDLRDWRRREGGDPTGALYEYTTDDGTVSRYWDDTACLCYAEAFRADGTYAQLARWWERKDE